MHDTKLTATPAHQQLLLPESALDKLASTQYFHRQCDLVSQHLYKIYQPESKRLALSLGGFPEFSPSRPDDIWHIQNQGCLVPFLQRLKDFGNASEILHHAGVTSGLSDATAEYTYSDLLHARRLYESLTGAQAALTLPVSLHNLYQRVTGKDILFPGQNLEPRSNFIEDISSVISPPAQHPLSSPLFSSSSRPMPPVCMSTTDSLLPSSVYRCFSISPNSAFTRSHHHQQIVGRPNHISSVPRPPDVTLNEDIAFSRNRTFLSEAHPPSMTAFPHFWQPSLTCQHSSQSPISRFQYTHRMSPANIDQHNSPSTSPSLHNLHHYLTRHRLVTESLPNRTSTDSCGNWHDTTVKQLPTKSLKQARQQERRDLRGALHTDRVSRVHKSTSTQTQFSSLNYKNLPPPRYFTASDTITHHTNSAPGHTFHHNFHPLAPPPPLIQCFDICSQSSSTKATPTPLAPPLLHKRKTSLHSRLDPITPTRSSHVPPSQIRAHPSVRTIVENNPLNLSFVSATPLLSIAPPTQLSLEDRGSYQYRCGSDESCDPRLSSSASTSSKEIVTQVSDEAIEEHFRRSLGQSYDESSSPKITAVHLSEQTGSVDDHFARALGNQTWIEIKARSEPSPSNPLSDAVDAHFSKALGAATWERLQAENKPADDASFT